MKDKNDRIVIFRFEMNEFVSFDICMSVDVCDFSSSEFMTSNRKWCAMRSFYGRMTYMGFFMQFNIVLHLHLFFA